MKKDTFMKGAIIATAAIIVSKILGILYVIPFYNIIGVKGGALYGYAYNIYNVFLIISSAGIPLAISKITAEYEAKKAHEKKKAMYDLASKIILIFSLLSFLICFIFAKPLAHLIIGDLTGGNTIGDITFVIRCVSFALLVVPLLSISRGYLQGHKYITPSSMSQVIEQVVRIAVILIGSYLAVKVFNIPLKYAVGISVLSACISAIVAYIYLQIKMRKLKRFEKVSIKEVSKKDKKEIVGKLIGYSVPFIIVSIAGTIYNTTDMILLMRGLKIVGYSTNDIETISSIFTTWGAKLLSILDAFATGLIISLIPSIVTAYNNKNIEEVNTYFNKTLQILLYIITPLAIGMSIFSKNVWTIFYGESYYGPIIFQFIILVSILDNAYLMVYSALQGLYKTKLVYIGALTGIITNLLLDIPLLLLFDKLGIYPFYGCIASTIIGYSISLSIPLIYLHKKEKISYKETFKSIPKLLISLVILIVTCLLYRHYFSVEYDKLANIIYIGIIGILEAALYYAINYKTINKLLGDKIKKIIKK